MLYKDGDLPKLSGFYTLTVKNKILHIDLGAADRRLDSADIQYQQYKTTGGVISDKTLKPLLNVRDPTNFRKYESSKLESFKIADHMTADHHDDESERFCEIVEDLDEEDKIEKELI